MRGERKTNVGSSTNSTNSPKRLSKFDDKTIEMCQNRISLSHTYTHALHTPLTLRTATKNVDNSVTHGDMWVTRSSNESREFAKRVYGNVNIAIATLIE